MDAVGAPPLVRPGRGCGAPPPPPPPGVLEGYEPLEVACVTVFLVFLAVFLIVSPLGTCCGRPARLGCGWFDPEDELLLSEDWLCCGWDEDELLGALEELGSLPPPTTLGVGTGALGVATGGDPARTVSGPTASGPTRSAPTAPRWTGTRR